MVNRAWGFLVHRGPPNLIYANFNKARCKLGQATSRAVPELSKTQAQKEREKGGEKMIKALAKLIRRKLLKVSWFRCRVEAYQLTQKRKRIEQYREQYHLEWKLFLSGRTARGSHTEKTDHRTQAIVADDGIRVDYMDGRMVGQRYVGPVYINSTQWGVGN